MKILKAFPVLSVIVAAELLLMSVSSGFAGEKGQIALANASFNGASKYRVYIGTYTNGDSKGIYSCTLNMQDGSLTNLKLAAESVNPSFLAIHPNRRFLYAVNEVSDFQGKTNNGGVSAFAINQKTGKLTLLNQQSTGGASPCHLVVDAAGKNVLVANYHGGSIAAYSIQQDGSLSKATTFIQHTGSSVISPRQDEPHAHSINLDAANRFAFVADLGLDKVLVYRFDSAGNAGSERTDRCFRASRRWAAAFRVSSEWENRLRDQRNHVHRHCVGIQHTTRRAESVPNHLDASCRLRWRKFHRGCAGSSFG
ncbi:MAG: lactonase family protein [Planctomycetes bacterium]|nr:lactonase family protein [Planctomycetota bacterium]